jgi:molybdopterin/thiamine biosynthesis adenylyltransferase
MPAEIRFTTHHYDELVRHLLADDDEHAAVVMCGTVTSGDHRVLTCREVVAFGTDDMEPGSGRLHLEISPLALARLAKQATRDRATMVVAHSHPFSGLVRASQIDLITEADLCGRALYGRLQRPVGALILGPDGYDGRLWEAGSHEGLRLRVGGQVVGMEGARPAPEDEQDSRQLLIWGHAGQAKLQQARIAVVGTGGTGSHVALQLAHLGIGRLLLIDPDLVERTNLSRLLGASTADIGRPKADVVAAAARRVRSGLAVETILASVLEIDPTPLIEADLIVCCTDGHGSRSLLNELATQYLVTLVDLGVEVQPKGRRARAGGGVRIIRPGEPCLSCMRVLDPALVREEFLSDGERLIERGHGYLRGSDEPAPAVVALNGVVASLAVLEVLNELLGLMGDGVSRLLYRAEARSLTTACAIGDVGCYVCGSEGIIGMGDGRSLPRRSNQPRASSS